MKESDMTKLNNDLSQEREINAKLTRQIKDLHFEK